VGLLKQGEELSHAQLRVEGFESVRQEWNRISKRQQERIEELERQEKARAETRDELNRAAGLFIDLKEECDLLKQRVEGLKTHSGELHDDLVMMMQQRNTLKQRLRDVMIEACNRPLDVTVAIAKAAGYVRCKRCDGDGILMMEIGLSGGKRCDCINGWREANDV